MTKKKIQKEPVRLREQVLSDGSKSLYLDIYRSGKRKREFLKLYLVKEKTPFDKEQNRQTLATAQAIKAKRQIELQNGEYAFTKQIDRSATVWGAFYKYCEEHKKGANPRGNYNCWHGVYTHLKEYCNESFKVADIDEEWVSGFIKYLDNAYTRRNNIVKVGEKLSQRTKFNYFTKIISFIKKACEDRIILSNPLKGITRVERGEAEREFLTVEELRKLAKTPCHCPHLRSAFLFSCLTGLRVSDIKKLTWGELQKFGDFHRIVFNQKKTGGLEYLDINEQAFVLMGKPGEPDEKVFKDFHYSSGKMYFLREWVKAAGINKDITFHCARHTFAVMMCSLGTDLYTVSKLLGHRRITTTQVYAKILDKSKQDAIQRIPKI